MLIFDESDIDDNTVINEVSTYDTVSQELLDGSVNAYEDTSVFIPLEVTPRTGTGEIRTSWCGEPTDTFLEDRGNGKCCLTIIQPIRVEIPLEFDAEALIGNLYVKGGEEMAAKCEAVCEKNVADSSLEAEEQQVKPKIPMSGYKTFY